MTFAVFSAELSNICRVLRTLPNVFLLIFTSKGSIMLFSVREWRKVLVGAQSSTRESCIISASIWGILKGFILSNTQFESPSYNISLDPPLTGALSLLFRFSWGTIDQNWMCNISRNNSDAFKDTPTGRLTSSSVSVYAAEDTKPQVRVLPPKKRWRA